MSKEEILQLVEDILKNRLSDLSVDETIRIIAGKCLGLPKPQMKPKFVQSQPLIIQKALKEMSQSNFFTSIADFKKGFYQHPELKEIFANQFLITYLCYLYTLSRNPPELGDLASKFKDQKVDIDWL